MTDLRKAAEMALDALENHTAIKHPQQIAYRDEAIQALRQALAQPEENELLKHGWRQCAVGQRTTQYCGMAEQAKLEERETCAKVCDELITYTRTKGYDDAMFAAIACATAIRARGEK